VVEYTLLENNKQVLRVNTKQCCQVKSINTFNWTNIKILSRPELLQNWILSIFMKDEDEDNIIPKTNQMKTQMIQTNLLMKDLKI
jgi:hypothetical protein